MFDHLLFLLNKMVLERNTNTPKTIQSTGHDVNTTKIRPSIPNKKRDDSNDTIGEDYDLLDPIPAGEVTDEEIVEVLSLLQLVHALVIMFLSVVGLWSIADYRKDADHIPEKQILVLQLVESVIMIASGCLNRWAPLFSGLCNPCCSVNTIKIRIIILRAVAFMLNVALIIFQGVEVFLPPKPSISKVAIGTIFTLECSFYLGLLFFSGRLLIRNKHGENRFKQDDYDDRNEDMVIHDMHGPQNESDDF